MASDKHSIIIPHEKLDYRYVDGLARALWPGGHVIGLARALGVKHWQAEQWLSGYRAMGVDELRGLASYINSVFCNVLQNLEEYANARQKAVTERKAGTLANMVASNARASQVGIVRLSND